jgi:hypothetical protein
VDDRSDTTSGGTCNFPRHAPHGEECTTNRERVQAGDQGISIDYSKSGVTLYFLYGVSRIAVNQQAQVVTAKGVV